MNNVNVSAFIREVKNVLKHVGERLGEIVVGTLVCVRNWKTEGFLHSEKLVRGEVLYFGMHYLVDSIEKSIHFNTLQICKWFRRRWYLKLL